MNETKQKSSQAMCASAIRKELKQSFPETKFKVTSESFANGNAVDVDWTDGPTRNQIEEITKKYQYGSFNGMIDYYEHTNSREDLPQAKFVQTRREYSDKLNLQTAQEVAKEFDLKIPQTIEEMGENIPFDKFSQWYNYHQLAWKVLQGLDLTNVVKVKADPKFESGAMFDGYIVEVA